MADDASELTGWLLGTQPDTRRLARVVALVPDELVDSLAAVAWRIPAPVPQLRVLVAIARRGGGPVDPALVRLILDRARVVDADDAKADAYVALAPIVRGEALAGLLQDARAIGDPALRDATVVSVEIVLDAWSGIRHATGHEPGGSGPGDRLPPSTDGDDAGLVHRLERMSPPARAAVLAQALDEARRVVDSWHARLEHEAAGNGETNGGRTSGGARPEEARDGGDVGAEPPKPGGHPTRPHARPPQAIPPAPPLSVAPVPPLGVAPVPPLSVAPVPPKRVVSTGMAARARPDKPLDPEMTLVTGSDYVFWLEIGAPVAGSIESSPVGAPADLAVRGARLTVALFDVAGGTSVIAGSDRGELRLRPDGSALVRRQPSGDAWPGVEVGILRRRLLFPVRTPARSGALRLRCNLYHQGVLIQSRLIRCRVQKDANRNAGALRSRLDYALTHSVVPARLAAAAPHALSLMVNRNEGGTHGLYFAGGDGTWTSGATFDTGELQAFLDQARGALRLAAWGTEKAWDGEPYRYDGAPDRDRLARDLIPICTRGYSFYSALIDRLAGAGPGDADRAGKLARVMRTPGSVQIALHDKPRFVIPAALIYDYDLDTGTRLADYTICEQFLADLARPDGLRTSACFAGNCPNRSDHVTVICPSGLWGYRHAIGLPVSLPGTEEWSAGAAADPQPDAGDPPGEIAVDDAVEVAVGVSTDPALKLWPKHEIALRSLEAGIDWRVADTRSATFDLLRTSAPHVVYFYCHGGVANGRPFIQVGPRDDQAIFSDNLRARHVRWDAPRPLVFINGCHTTAVEPEVAHELVSGFVTIARASGVIGTEITIFEPLAAAFAEAFLRAFLGGATVGAAVRTARLSLLQAGNPLGLAYTAYALANLRVVGPGPH